jgi:hypothetical protein
MYAFIRFAESSLLPHPLLSFELARAAPVIKRRYERQVLLPEAKRQLLLRYSTHHTPYHILSALPRCSMHHTPYYILIALPKLLAVATFIGKSWCLG